MVTAGYLPGCPAVRVFLWKLSFVLSDRIMQKTMNSYRVEQFYSSIKDQEIERLQRQVQFVLPPDAAFLQQVGLRPGMNVLDLGCGPGITSCKMAQFTYPGEVIGVDQSESMLEQAQRLQKARGINNLIFQMGCVNTLLLPEASFDFIYARLLFQHLTDPVQVMRKVYQILKPGGVFCAIDVDHQWFGLYPEVESFTALCQQLLIAQADLGGNPFVGRKLGGYCLQAGLQVVKTRVEVIHSDRIGLETFFNLLSFGAPFRRGDSELDELAAKAKTEVYALLELPYAWAGCGLFVVTARKPTTVI
jgi:ubiquinone/menaquinone biosynthesis C-methylase UbiE